MRRWMLVLLSVVIIFGLAVIGLVDYRSECEPKENTSLNKPATFVFDKPYRVVFDRDGNMLNPASLDLASVTRANASGKGVRLFPWQKAGIEVGVTRQKLLLYWKYDVNDKLADGRVWHVGYIDTDVLDRDYKINLLDFTVDNDPITNFSPNVECYHDMDPGGINIYDPYEPIYRKGHNPKKLFANIKPFVEEGDIRLINISVQRGDYLQHYRRDTFVSAGDVDLLNGWTLNSFNPNLGFTGQRYMHSHNIGSGNHKTTYEQDEFIFVIVDGKSNHP